MKITCSWRSFRDAFEKRTLDLVSFLTLAAELGFDGIEAGAGVFPSVSQRFLRELRGIVRVSPVEIAAIRLANDFARPEASEREDQCDDIVAWTFVSQELGVPVLCTSTGELREGTNKREAKSRVYECYEKVLGAAERAGVTLAVGPGHGERRVLRSCAELAELVMHFGSGSLQLSADPRDFLAGSSPVASEATYASLGRVARLSVHSRLDVLDAGGRTARDAWGGLDLARVIQVYRAACYDRTVSLEYLGDGDARKALREGVIKLRGLLGG